MINLLYTGWESRILPSQVMVSFSFFYFSFWFYGFCNNACTYMYIVAKNIQSWMYRITLNHSFFPPINFFPSFFFFFGNEEMKRYGLLHLRESKDIFYIFQNTSSNNHFSTLYSKSFLLFKKKFFFIQKKIVFKY